MQLFNNILLKFLFLFAEYPTNLIPKIVYEAQLSLINVITFGSI